MFFCHETGFARPEGDPWGSASRMGRDSRTASACSVTGVPPSVGFVEPDGKHETGRARYGPHNLAGGVMVGWFPDRDAALGDVGVDRVITP